MTPEQFAVKLRDMISEMSEVEAVGVVHPNAVCVWMADGMDPADGMDFFIVVNPGSVEE